MIAYQSIITGTATIPLATFSGLVGDGNLNFLFDYSSFIDDFVTGSDLAQVRIQYEARDLNAVPEPGTLLLFGSGLAGLAAWRFRKKSSQA